MLSSKLNLKLSREKKKSTIESLSTFEDCNIEYQTRVYTLKDSEVVPYCEENRINRKFLYYFSFDSNIEWEYNQYFTSTKDTPLLMAVIPMIKDPALVNGNHFFIVKNPDDEQYYIWGIQGGVILTINEEFPACYKTRALAIDSIEVIAALKGISDYDVLDVKPEDLTDSELSQYRFRPVTKSLREKVIISSAITLSFIVSIYTGWNISFGLY
ncbi:hypothetical protein KI655_05270 [Vibrio sp. D404a]|uniref:hypothetical protein n=1 Tax=unclassified Vibrio TaxID=2614977 RepID=UPI0025535B90|nr:MULTISPECIES: hypothetical protein [unclassified Vibrio]MDK9736705.1 hypothetical protein [Vibrio sp. D404a]MDK9797014.1 hypothetical protein [Vibrio sp. D449a]